MRSRLADLLAFPVVKGHLQRSLNALKEQVEARPRARVRRVPGPGNLGRVRTHRLATRRKPGMG